MKKIIIKFFLIFVVLAFLLINLKEDKWTKNLLQKETKQQSLTIDSPEWNGSGADIVTMGTGYDIQKLVIDSLFHKSVEGKLMPNMAKKYSISEDGKVVTIELANDLRFYDGSLVKAGDVKRSFEWIKDKSPFANDLSDVYLVKAEGNTVIFHLRQPSQKFLTYLSSYFFPIIKAEDIDNKSSEEILWEGTVYGAYYVSEYVSGSYATLKKNPYYKNYSNDSENKTFLMYDTINVQFNLDSNRLLQEVLAEHIALTGRIMPSQLEDIKMNPNIGFTWISEPTVVRMILNSDADIFKDPDVRLALMLLIDRKQVVEYSKGQYSPAYAYSVSGMSDYSSSVESYFKDKYCNQTNLALSLLKNRGWIDSNGDGYLDKDGKNFEFTIAFGNNDLNDLTEALQLNLKTNGIKMNIENIDSSKMEDMLQKDKFEAALSQFNWEDTEGVLPYMSLYTDMLDNDAYNILIKESNRIMDRNSRINNYAKAQKMLMDTKCNFPIARMNNLIVFNKMLLPSLNIRNSENALKNNNTN